MNKGQHNTFKKLSPDFFSIEKYPCTILSNLIYYVQGVKGESLFLFCHFNNDFNQSSNCMNQKPNLS